MKQVFFWGIVAFLFAAANVWAGQGEEIFKAQRCSSCHKQETGKANPSLKEIARAYQGKKDQLLNYLNGSVTSIIRPGTTGIMKRYVEKTRFLSEEDRKALADFIMSHGQ